MRNTAERLCLPRCPVDDVARVEHGRLDHFSGLVRRDRQLIFDRIRSVTTLSRHKVGRALNAILLIVSERSADRSSRRVDGLGGRRARIRILLVGTHLELLRLLQIVLREHVLHDDWFDLRGLAAETTRWCFLFHLNYK